jgi:hypothetical protein
MHFLIKFLHFLTPSAGLPHITNAEARELTPAKWLAARQAKTLTA